MSEERAGSTVDGSSAPRRVFDVGPRLRCTATADGPLELTLEGTLTSEGVTRLHSALLDLTPDMAQRLTAGDVTLDLAAISIVDVEALRLLVRLDQALEKRGHTVRLRRPTPALQRVVAGAGLLDVLPFTTTP